MRVAVIGAGISGLSAAYELHRNGVQVVLYESSARLGGIVKSSRVNVDGLDFTVELGPDGWVAEKPWARELAVELGLEDQLTASQDENRRTLLLRNGELLAFPEGMRMMVPGDEAAMLSTRWLSEEARQGFLSEPARAQELRDLALKTDDISVADFVTRHFGAEVARTFAGPLLAGVFGGDIAQLSAASVMPAFLKMAREHGSLVLALRYSPRFERPSMFMTMRGGMSSLVDAIASAIPSDAIRMQCAVSTIEREGAGWAVSAGNGPESFDAILLATPAHETRRLLQSIDPGLSAMHSFRASSGVMAVLMFGQELQLPSGFGLLVEQPQPGTHPAFLAATFTRRKYPHSVPPGGDVLRVFFGGEKVAEIDSLREEEIAAVAHREISRHVLALPAPLAHVVQRWPSSLPQYDVGHGEGVHAIEQRLRRHHGLLLLGNAYHGVGLPDLVRDARAKVRGLFAPSR